MSDRPPFIPFPKVPRWNRGIVITEKIDGTNASVTVLEDGTVLAASRKRWVTPEDDNYGFAAWAKEHADELRGLGVGTHFGEWWGKGIQRGYGMNGRRFSLFNTARWADGRCPRPACCDVVPTLYTGGLSHDAVENALDSLRIEGSVAASGWEGQAEGIVIFHVSSNSVFKVLLENDELPKSLVTPE